MDRVGTIRFMNDDDDDETDGTRDTDDTELTDMGTGFGWSARSRGRPDLGVRSTSAVVKFHDERSKGRSDLTSVG